MKIFISADSGQIKPCLDALRSDLSAVGAEVVVQEDFQQRGASLLEKLERYIASCDRIIALVGDAYGFEPEETARPAGRPRRSYTQWEYCFAMGERLDGSRQPPKDIFLYIGSPEFLAMNPVSQAEDSAQLQQEFTLQQEFIKELVRSGRTETSGLFTADVDKSYRAHRVLGQVVAQFQLRIVQEATEPAPMRKIIGKIIPKVTVWLFLCRAKEYKMTPFIISRRTYI
jgi:hypothetical protein